MQARLLELAGRLESVAKGHAGLAHVRETSVFRALQATEPKAWCANVTSKHMVAHDMGQPSLPGINISNIPTQHMDWDGLVAAASGKGAVHSSSVLKHHIGCLPTHTAVHQHHSQPSPAQLSTDHTTITHPVSAADDAPMQRDYILPPLACGPCGLLLPAFMGGYPQRPLLNAVCQALAAWVLTAQFPFPEVEQVTPNLLEETDLYRQKKLWLQSQVTYLFRVSHVTTHRQHDPHHHQQRHDQQHHHHDSHQHHYQQQHVSHPSQEIDIDERVLEAVLTDPHALLILLGFRITTGTTDQVAAVPGLQQCVDAFGDLNSPTSKSHLTAGARALSKHCHRDSSAFWGNPSGPEAVKNQLAGQLLARLLQGAVWINLHYVPPDKHVLELRVAKGYGARWEVTLPNTARIEKQSDDTDDIPAYAEDMYGGTNVRGRVLLPADHDVAPHTSHNITCEQQQQQQQQSDQGISDIELPVVKFRGFLEPQMADGHQLGWQH